MSEKPASAPYTEADLALIQKIIPHRYPFLMIDKVRDIVPYKSAVGIKMVTNNEPHFQGHFPNQPVMPGVLVIEALAQAGGVLTQVTHGGGLENRLSYMVKVDNARFLKMVVPGDRLELEVTIKREIRNMTQYCGVARVDGQQVASADILCAEVKT